MAAQADENRYTVTAIVSIYKAQKFIKACLEDLVRQTLFEQTEVIVIDACSPENEKGIVQKFCARYPNIIYVRTQEREPLYASWNRAIKMASGKYITNANADDRHHPQCFEILSETLDKHPEVAVAYSDQRITSEENALFETATVTGHHHLKEIDYIGRLFSLQVGSQPMWRTTLHKEFGYFDESFMVAGDYDFWLRISEKYPFKHVQNELGLYFRSSTDENLEHKDKQLTYEELRRAKETAIRRFLSPKFHPDFPLRPLLAVHMKHLNKIYNGIFQEQQCSWEDLNRTLFTCAILQAKLGDVSGAKKLLYDFFNLLRGESRNLCHLYRLLLLGSPGEPPAVSKPVSPVQSSPLVSVVIPLYNQGQFLKEAVYSVLAQTQPRWEMIIVNDGSTDDSLQQAQKILAEVSDPRIKLVSHENQGKGKTRNRGVKETSAPFVCILDADDMLAPQYFSTVLSIFEKDKEKNIGWVCPQTLLFGANNRTTWFWDYNFFHSLLKSPSPVSAIYRRDMYEEVNGYTESMTDAEDYEFWIKAGECGWQAKTTTEHLFIYRHAFQRYGCKNDINVKRKEEYYDLHPWWYKNVSQSELLKIFSSSSIVEFPQTFLSEQAVNFVKAAYGQKEKFKKAIEKLQVAFTKGAFTNENNNKKILFYFFKNVHLPILLPLYKALQKELASLPEKNIEIGFSYLPPAPQIRAGLNESELQTLRAFHVPVYSTPQEFEPDLTFIADSVYPWVQGCGKLVHVGHGVLSKGQYYTDTAIARREEEADLICVPGKHHQAIMRRILSKPVVATGMCKLDELFAGKISREKVLQRYNLPDKRYVLFAPTFNDELSSIPCVGDKIGEVLPDDDTLLVIKLHPSSKPEYKKMYSQLPARNPRIIYADELDITPFLALCDVMISDVSSAMMEFAALDKPLVLFNNPNWETYQNYNPQDIEFQWRDIGLQVSTLKEMKEAVAQCLQNPASLSQKRQHYTDLLFANKKYGNAAERIVKLALSMLNG